MSLQGKRILVTRAKAQASALSFQIQKNGGVPIELPLITITGITDKTAILNAINTIHTYNWIVFTSKNGIDFFMKEYMAYRRDIKIPCKIAVVGKKTEESLLSYGLKADLLPETFVAESLLQSLSKVVHRGERVLIPRGNLARDVISDGLRANQIFVQELTVYETVIEKSSKDHLYRAIKNHEIDIVTFTSSSTVDYFVRLLEGTKWREYIEQLMFVSIGPITTKTMLKHRLPVHIEPEEYTIQGMLTSIMETLKEERSC
ncbi:uroporphyrinogen-III synthase [Anaerobacillus alkaliphilus]|uniref:Uroporphyrinogen-III synthase n=1 Tax=Anaerobacillus alkaliphilus TaxID=1548597 RepID=A0A4Q0VSP0_9BACI|nr:uroporphyrinogen-III synthase [Anaerobacillus alkaliphilus]RXI98440.1 uroporphyrinogen-III synthase [Anaerobacillus alkaliphilus]